MVSQTSRLVNNINIRNFVFNNQGEKWLEEHPDTVDLLIDTVDSKLPNEHLQNQKLHRIGSGTYSDVYDCDDIALKISSSLTGRMWFTHGKTTPENLITQHLFLDKLFVYLSLRSDNKIVVPTQLFALTTNNGTSLKGEELMSGWRSVHAFSAEQRWSPQMAGKIAEILISKIRAENLPKKHLRMINDLGIKGRTPFNFGNIMIQSKSLDLNNLTNQSLCIIDQPGRFIFQSSIRKLIKFTTGGVE